MPDELLTELIDVKLPEIIEEALTVDLAPLISELRLSEGQQAKLADEARSDGRNGWRPRSPALC